MRDSETKNLARGLTLLEGPRWHANRLFVSDLFLQRVIAFDESGHGELICEVPGRPSGLGFDPDGQLLISSMADRSVLRLGDAGLETVADLSHLVGGDLNDMAVDTMGRAYVGNFGSDLAQGEEIRPTTLVMVDSPTGAVTQLEDEVIFPNGMVVTPDARTLIVAESFAFRISAFDLNPDGTLSGRREWARFGEIPSEPTLEAALGASAIIPDGIALDSEGALWVADAAGSGALRVREGGEVVERVEFGEDTAYAVALGGADGSTLFVCTAPPLGQVDPERSHRSSLWSRSVDVPLASR